MFTPDLHLVVLHYLNKKKACEEKKTNKTVIFFFPLTYLTSLHSKVPELHSSIQHHITTSGAIAIILLILLTPTPLPRCCRTQGLHGPQLQPYTVFCGMDRPSCEKMSPDFLTLFIFLEYFL